MYEGVLTLEKPLVNETPLSEPMLKTSSLLYWYLLESDVGEGLYYMKQAFMAAWKSLLDGPNKQHQMLTL